MGSKLALMGQTVEVEVEVPPQRWRAYVPGLAVVTSYQRAWLTKDIVAGLVLSALLVPQGMAYADLAGLPAVTGLYTSILCLSRTPSSDLPGCWCLALTRRWAR